MGTIESLHLQLMKWLFALAVQLQQGLEQQTELELKNPVSLFSPEKRQASSQLIISRYIKKKKLNLQYGI